VCIQWHTREYGITGQRAASPMSVRSSTTNDATGTARHSPSLAAHLAGFCRKVSWDSLPSEVQEKARLHTLDTLGLALASHAQEYAAPALAGIAAVAGPGECTVIGDERRFAPRDAALANGLLMHGLDYDDTHPASIVHPSVVGLPAALAIGEQLDAAWNDVLTSYVIGVEAAIRIGAAVQGGFHHAGFHATGIVSHFGAALAAGKLLDLDESQLVAVQGIAASTASGVQVFLEEGAWSKRLHPGWGALAGITAAHLARCGFVAPTRPYEGKFGLFESHLHGSAAAPDRITEGLGERWRLLETAIKPYPVCHFIHGCLEAAVELHGQFVAGDVEKVIAWLPEDTLPIVAEPAQVKQHASTEYEAKFSAQFVVAKALHCGRFGLAELTPAALSDPATRNLAVKVICRADPMTQFPSYFSGGVTVVLKDGRELHRHVPINKGAGTRALSAEDIQEKFLANSTLRLNESRARGALDAIMSVRPRSVRSVMETLRASRSV
jgi:2-methylcitrate dehydratase PrpD